MTTLRKVLVVDDDPVVGKSFDRVLSGKGYAVITASGGQEALDKLAAENYDLVFTDIKMPGMSGIEVAARIKATRPWLPVVIVTGYGSEANEAQANEIGVSGFLRKPLSPEMIEDSAQAAVLDTGTLETTSIAAPAPGEKSSALQNLALLVAAPFIGLAFVVAFPFIGLFALAKIGARALAARYGRIARFARNVALFLAAPFIGLAYALAFPFIGIGILAWKGLRALLSRSGPRQL